MTRPQQALALLLLCACESPQASAAQGGGPQPASPGPQAGAAQGGGPQPVSAGRSAPPGPAAPAGAPALDADMDAGAADDNQTLAGGQAWPIALQLSATHVYWAGGAIARIPKLGGPTEALVWSQGRPNSLQLDAQFAYWAEAGGSLLRAPINGGPSELLGASAGFFSWALGEDVIYFADLAGELISAMPKTGGASHTVITPSDARANTTPSLMRVHGAEVYWTQQETGMAGDITVIRLYRTRPGASAQEVVAEEQAVALGDVVFDDDNVYWSVSELYESCPPGTPCSPHGAVRAKPLAGGEARTIAGDERYPDALALDGERVYWTSLTGIRAAYKDGSDVKTVLRVSSAGTVSIAVDDASIYWAIYDQAGTIGRAAKKW